MATATKEITNGDDIVDVRDVIARVEELEAQPTVDEVGDCYSCGSQLKPNDEDHETDCEVLELQRLTALLEDLAGNGGDEEWRGAWYPVTLIRESHFREYAEELAEDIGAINSDAAWPNNHIDWNAAADELLVDYAAVVFDGVEYYYR